ncbi:hypothetical protein [Alienimonas sp. DA493]|uniref:hypothetical protein n=1 Tax=Alienimonas sp. DA493 TaxID=3373605 RepID=UPI0037548DCA
MTTAPPSTGGEEPPRPAAPDGAADGSPGRTVAFTVATNGYDQTFADCLESQRAWADRHGYAYLVLDGAPPGGIDGAESAWLKIFAIRELLDRPEVAHVVFLDADATVRPHAPAAPTDAGFSILAARDHTGRYNSGVLLVRAADDARAFFRRLCRMADVPPVWLPKRDRNLWENGHFIYLARKTGAVGDLDPQWNFTSGLEAPGGPDGWVEGEEYVCHGRGRYLEKPRTGPKPGRWAKALRRLRRGSRTLRVAGHLRHYRPKLHAAAAE